MMVEFTDWEPVGLLITSYNLDSYRPISENLLWSFWMDQNHASLCYYANTVVSLLFLGGYMLKLTMDAPNWRACQILPMIVVILSQTSDNADTTTEAPDRQIIDTVAKEFLLIRTRWHSILLFRMACLSKSQFSDILHLMFWTTVYWVLEMGKVQV